MKCERCGNEDPNYFYHGKRGRYCRKCVSFLEENKLDWSLTKEDCDEYYLSYSLSSKQKEISYQCALAIEYQDVLLRCVCGSGKTEMVLETISKQLKKGKVVGFAVPRREVVLELKQRLAEIFRQAKVIAVCAGHTKETQGDIVVCTTHQLYRYGHAFDVLILDEPDAFPFKNNPVLWGFAQRACLGHTVFLSATPNEIILKRENLKILRLDQRPHGKPLVVPRLKYGLFVTQLIRLCRWLRNRKTIPCMVFLPTISLTNGFYRIFHCFYPCERITSESQNKEEIVTSFRKGKFHLLFCTTVMERGITIEGVDVCVWKAEHAVFDQASLIQIAGRVGRKFAHPSGDVLFLCQERSKVVEKAIQSIKVSNALSSL
ncbi:MULTISPECIES: helicase-related protein [Terrabacteria group]|uniref:helicase-related protein n=1 Tax=Bacillati TaxID=1783272 RepID=UPI001C6EBD87|nr:MULTISPECIES: helicase-related protein [Terrabacteria group]MBW9212725.1 DEAD/DEAH box helicase family protein [Trueperella sp. zg.1013]